MELNGRIPYLRRSPFTVQVVPTAKYVKGQTAWLETNAVDRRGMKVREEVRFTGRGQEVFLLRAYLQEFSPTRVIDREAGHSLRDKNGGNGTYYHA